MIWRVVGFGEPARRERIEPAADGRFHRDMDSQPQLAIRTLFQLINEQISEADIESPHISATQLVDAREQLELQLLSFEFLVTPPVRGSFLRGSRRTTPFPSTKGH